MVTEKMERKDGEWDDDEERRIFPKEESKKVFRSILTVNIQRSNLQMGLPTLVILFLFSILFFSSAHRKKTVTEGIGFPPFFILSLHQQTTLKYYIN